ncbi:DUF2388 domain-containing protein [Pseudomonas gessardii]|nr:DUF2388 domain-containing protein [Pseudomonas gessardii]
MKRCWLLLRGLTGNSGSFTDMIELARCLENPRRFNIPELFKSSKSDALAFIGSDGEIRGAQFEQACRYYRSAYKPPLMSDAQLALAIAAAG